MKRFRSLYKRIEDIKNLLSPKERPQKIIDECVPLENSLYEFLKSAWHVVEGNKPFVDSWHIKVICEHLEASFYGHIKKLMINVPPRTSKTTIISIMWPAWIWMKRPSTKFVFASYAQKISFEHSRLCRMLIESQWYKERWGHVVQISKDQAGKEHFVNTKLGHRIATSVQGGTALGGDILVCLPESCYIDTNEGRIKIGELVNKELSVRVLSYNHFKGLVEYKEIEKYEKRHTFETLEIEFEDGSLLECTSNHPIYQEFNGYVRAELLRKGDFVWGMEFVQLVK